MPEPDLRPWYFSRRWEISGVVAVAFLGLAFDTLRAGHGRGWREGLGRARIYGLLACLLVVGVWALEVQQRRADRALWRRPLHVAVTLVALEELPTQAVEAFRDKARRTTEALAAERARHGQPGSVPFWFHVFGPVAARRPPPRVARGAEPLLSRAQDYLALRSELDAIDEQSGLAAGRYDVRAYVYARSPRSDRVPLFVEGEAEAGGEIALVHVDLSAAMAELAWIATAHEVLHTVGALDKYDGRGRARMPDGLADPAREPLFPQAHAEIMVGEVPLSPHEGRLPEGWNEVRVGNATALEIGW